MPDPQDDPRYRGLKKAEGIGPQPGGGLAEMIGDMMTSSVGGRGFPSRLSPSGEGNPGPVDIMGMLAGSKLAKYLYGKATSAAGDAGIKAISKDPMALTKGPMDRRNFLYRSTPIPEKLRQSKVVQAGNKLSSNWDEAAKMAATGDMDGTIKLVTERMPDEAYDAIDASSSLKRHFGTPQGSSSRGIRDVNQAMEADEAKRMSDLRTKSILTKQPKSLLKITSDPDIDEAVASSILDSEIKMLAAEELKKGKLWTPPDVPDIQTPSALGGLLKRYGVQAMDEIKDTATDAAKQTAEVPSTVQSFFSRFGVGKK